jgi:hypothetical protein
MSAWSRPGQVVFIQPPGGRFTPNWSIQAGGRTKRDLQTIADEIGVDFDLG